MDRWHAQLINPDNDSMCYLWSLRFSPHKLLTVEKLLKRSWCFLIETFCTCRKQTRLLNSIFPVVLTPVVISFIWSGYMHSVITPRMSLFLNMRNWMIISSLFPLKFHSSTWSESSAFSVIYLKEKRKWLLNNWIYKL